MKKEVLIVLGSPNSPSGKLSDISLSRLNYCVNHYQPGNLILCTGGWGAHFNTSEHAHASLARQYLIENDRLVYPKTIETYNAWVAGHGGKDGK